MPLRPVSQFHRSKLNVIGKISQSFEREYSIGKQIPGRFEESNRYHDLDRQLLVQSRAGWAQAMIMSPAQYFSCTCRRIERLMQWPDDVFDRLSPSDLFQSPPRSSHHRASRLATSNCSSIVQNAWPIEALGLVGYDMFYGARTRSSNSISSCPWRVFSAFLNHGHVTYFKSDANCRDAGKWGFLLNTIQYHPGQN